MRLDDYVCRLVREFVIESAFFDWPPIDIRYMIVNRDIYRFIYIYIYVYIIYLYHIILYHTIFR